MRCFITCCGLILIIFTILYKILKYHKNKRLESYSDRIVFGTQGMNKFLPFGEIEQALIDQELFDEQNRKKYKKMTVEQTFTLKVKDINSGNIKK